MRRKFASRTEVDAYLGHEKIQCLECGKWFAFLANHLRHAHDMDADAYRSAWGLPVGISLAGTAYRAAHAEKIRRMQAAGTLTYDHLPAAVEAARHAVRTPKTLMDAAAQSARVAQRRPGDAHRLPPGARRADGRDADREREYQQAYRARIAGDEGPMLEFWEKWPSHSLGERRQGHTPLPSQIVHVRKQGGMSEEDAARALRATLAEYRAWETGEIPMHPGLLELLRIKSGSRRKRAQPRAFSEREDAILRTHSDRGVAWVARELGRTTPAVHKRADELGVSFAAQHRKFDPDEDQFILDHLDWPVTWVATQLGRAVQSVQWRAERVLGVSVQRSARGRPKKITPAGPENG